MTYHSGKPSMPSARSFQVHGKIRPLLEDDALWGPIDRGLVWLAIVFCGPVFAAVAAVLIFGG
ncbi:hypothetical protein LH128_00095 [Sphingomonas sp. LH128]|uniref:hypothetical protein n=1 Tax=Sphingomonas sp. LH128 TaxID=473781 RepID=UPI00027CB13E|nr:hypothetical protein [Sphingomonas sp. LH128]EJU15136.1 hypothetical protein LH128_00095 [Sphingomonas sp. LH128]